jgi:two-component system sensor histidine kinase KdpD
MNMTARPSHVRLLRGARPYAAAFAIVAASTLVSELLYRTFDTNRLSMVFLAGVLITAATLGSGPAYFAAALAFTIYNVYLAEPRFTLQLASAEDVLVLLVFAAVAVLTGRLTGRVRDEVERAEARARTANALFEASRDLSVREDEGALCENLARHVAIAAKGEALIWDASGEVYGLGAVAAPSLAEARALAQASIGSPAHARLDGWRYRPLFADGQDLGLAGWRSGDRFVGGDEEQLIAVLVDLGAAAVSRARLARAGAEVQASARTEQLRNALLSSISHDLRTPLAAILASASSLREFGEAFSPEVRDDLVATIEEEADRLNRFVANLLNMTKLESGALSLELVRVELGEVMDRLARRVSPRLGGRVLEAHVAPGLSALGEPLFLEQALANVLENAVRFTPAHSTIRILAQAVGSEVWIEITDEGPGLPPEDLPVIFDKFFRSATTAPELQGTGLGLSITQGLIMAMNGAVDAKPGPDRRGLTIQVVLPSAEP